MKRLKRKTFGYGVEVMTHQQRIREGKRGFLAKTAAKEEGKRRELEIKKSRIDFVQPLIQLELPMGIEPTTY